MRSYKIIKEKGKGKSEKFMSRTSFKYFPFKKETFVVRLWTCDTWNTSNSYIL